MGDREKILYDALARISDRLVFNLTEEEILANPDLSYIREEARKAFAEYMGQPDDSSD